MFVYLSYENQSNNYVYFDDFKVTHTKTNLIQYNDYYPFGLQAETSWTRENSTNNFLYNGGSELNNTSGWYETFFRGYDAALGRFAQVDPMASAFASLSPYNYGLNDPVFFNDPMGDYVQPTLPPEHVGPSFNDIFGGGGSNGFANRVADIYGGSPVPGAGYGSSYSSNPSGTTEFSIGGYTITIDWDQIEGDGVSFGLDDGEVESVGVISEENGQFGVWTDVYIDWFQDGQKLDSYYSHTYFKVLAQQGGLNFKTLWDDYGDGLSHTDPKTGKEIFPDYCAINLSEALIKSGMSPGGTKCYGNCSSKQSHTIRAQELSDWLQGNLPGVKVLTGENYEEYISGKTGIVFFQDYWQRDGESGTTGDHIDLWNKNEMGSYGVFDTWLRTTIPWLGPLRGMSDLSKSTQVLFWEIK